MKKILALTCTLLLVGAFAVAGCGKTPGGTSSTSGSPTISMDANDFTAHSINVKANQDVKLDDTVNGGGYHVLCIGTGNGGQGTGSCDKSGNGPSQLYGSDGMTITNGSTKTITFSTPGTYHLICTVHPGMYIDITVQ